MAEQEIRPTAETTEVKSELSTDDLRIWAELWAAVHTDHYACYYEEAVAEHLVSRWRLLDTLTKFLTALTASGSPVDAFPLWSSSTGGQVTRAIMTRVTAVISLG